MAGTLKSFANSIVSRRMLEPNEDLELSEAFNLFDADGDGQVIFNANTSVIFNGTLLKFLQYFIENYDNQILFCLDYYSWVGEFIWQTVHRQSNKTIGSACIIEVGR